MTHPLKINPQNVLLKAPLIKLWLNISDNTDIFTGLGVLWIIDFKKGLARKQLFLNEEILQKPYPEYITRFKNIEEFLLNFFCNNGLDIRIDSSKKEKGKIKFNPPLTDKFKIEK